jgi:hypothetical protein
VHPFAAECPVEVEPDPTPFTSGQLDWVARIAEQIALALESAIISTPPLSLTQGKRPAGRSRASVGRSVRTKRSKWRRKSAA